MRVQFRNDNSLVKEFQPGSISPNSLPIKNADVKLEGESYRIKGVKMFDAYIIYDVAPTPDSDIPELKIK